MEKEYNWAVDEYDIRSPSDILRTDIIDFNRVGSCWPNSGAAMDTIFSWWDPENYEGHTVAKVVVCEFDFYHNVPQRDDFPDWKHVGRHVEVAKSYWNFFFDCFPDGRLSLGDQPDFQAYLEDPFVPGNLNTATIHGDFGRVAAYTFARTQKRMRAGDIFIGIPGSGKRQVCLMSLISVVNLYADVVCGVIEPEVKIG